MVDRYQICLPVEALKHDTPCAAAQKGCSGLRCSHTSPDDQSGLFGPMTRHFPQGSEKNSCCFSTYKACGFGTLDGNNRERPIRLKAEGEKIQVPADRDTHEPGRQLTQPLQKCIGNNGCKGRIVFHPKGVHIGRLEKAFKFRLHEIFRGDPYLFCPRSFEGLCGIHGVIRTDVENGAGRRPPGRVDHRMSNLIGSPHKRKYRV